MNSDTGSVYKIMNKLLYFDLGTVEPLPSTHYSLERDEMMPGRRPTFGLTQFEKDGVETGNSLIGSRNLLMAPENNEDYEASRYYVQDWDAGNHAPYGPDFVRRKY